MGKDTEVGFIGWEVVGRGRELGLDCLWLMSRVSARVGGGRLSCPLYLIIDKGATLRQEGWTSQSHIAESYRSSSELG